MAQTWQTFDEAVGQDDVKTGLLYQRQRTDTLKSQFAGTAFPTTGLIVGQPCYRSDQTKLYVLTAIGPDVWTEVPLGGPLSVAKGGTGSTTAGGALVNLGALGVGDTAADSDLLNGQDGTYYLTPTNLASAVPVSKGGTGATTAAAARTALGAAGLSDANVFTGTQTWKQGADVAAATNMTLGDGNIFDITGTGTIATIASKGVGTVIILTFTGAATLTHSADLSLFGAANRTVKAGDVLWFKEYAVGDWKQVAYGSVAGAPMTQGRHSIYIPAKAWTARPTDGATAAINETTTNKIILETLDFPDGASKKYAQFWLEPPKAWDLGTLSAAFVWYASSGTAAQVAAWGIQAVAISDDDPIDAAFGTAGEVTDALTATGDRLRSGEAGPITVAGTPAVGDSVVLQIYRDPAHASDNLGASARLLGVILFINLNAPNDA